MEQQTLMHAARATFIHILRPRSKAEVLPLLERAVFGVGMINPLTAIPQLYQIWELHAVGGLSLFTVGAALLMSVLWTAYGALTRQTALWATSLVWIGMNGATVAGVIVHS
ncbi:MAG: hypothetical protein IBX63_03520 [Coriobacteriia bacterium]|nr:hypothetical protein [Coriobacteriia bacterium]